MLGVLDLNPLSQVYATHQKNIQGYRAGNGIILLTNKIC